MLGTVKWYNDSKGVGFIDGEDGIEYFVHSSQVSSREEFHGGERVQFEPEEGRGGKQPAAVNVQRV